MIFHSKALPLHLLVIKATLYTGIKVLYRELMLRVTQRRNPTGYTFQADTQTLMKSITMMQTV